MIRVFTIIILSIVVLLSIVSFYLIKSRFNDNSFSNEPATKITLINEADFQVDDVVIITHKRGFNPNLYGLEIERLPSYYKNFLKNGDINAFVNKISKNIEVYNVEKASIEERGSSVRFIEEVEDLNNAYLSILGFVDGDDPAIIHFVNNSVYGVDGNPRDYTAWAQIFSSSSGKLEQHSNFSNELFFLVKQEYNR